MPRSLLHRIGLLYIGSLGVALLAGLVLFLHHEVGREIEDIQEQSVMLAEVVVQAVTDSAILGDYDTLGKVLQNATQGGVFRSAELIDGAGGRLASADSRPRQSSAPAALVRWTARRLYDVNRPIVVGGRDYGVLRLRFESERVAGDLWVLGVKACGSAAAGLVLALLLLRLALRRWLTGLDWLARADGQLASGGVDVQPFADADMPLEIRRVADMVERTAQVIRERDAAQVAMRAARDAAEQASRAKGDFLANMSHEMRTPLNGILGFTELLLEGGPGPGQKRYLELIKTSGDSLLALINDVLDLAKVEAHMLTVDRRPVDVRAVLRETLEGLAVLAGDKALRLGLRVDQDVPRLLASDPTRLRQVLRNLVGNAIKFTERGSVTVLARVAESRDDTVSLQFTVRDTGVGVPAEARERIFQAFAQADTSITRQFGGTGLGLAISAQLAQLLGGRLWLGQSGPGGSEFHFSVIFGRCAEEVPRPSRLASILQPLEPGGGLRVLLVEDNPVNQELALVMLRRLGHRAEVARDGEEALARLDAGAFDVVLMDMQMPVMDGLTATRHLREREAERGLPRTRIVAMTANALVGDEQRCLDSGMDGYLSKPIRSRALKAALEMEA